MISLRRLHMIVRFSAPNYNPSHCYCSTVGSRKTLLSSAEYDELINAAGRKRDFPAVRHLLSKRLTDGWYNTNNTFKFIATNISALDDLLRNLADLDNWFTKKQAHDALVAQLAKLYRTDDALRVAEMMARKNYGATATTFCPIINALAKRKDMSEAWRVVDAMRACNIRPTLTAFNYILTAYCCVGDVAAGADVLVKMETERIKADANTYDALVLGACRAGNVGGALAVIRRAVEDGLPALFSTYTHIIKEMLDCGYYVQALELVEIFAGKNEKLDAELFGFLARRFKKLKRNAEAKSVVEEMVKRGLPISDDLLAI